MSDDFGLSPLKIEGDAIDAIHGLPSDEKYTESKMKWIEFQYDSSQSVSQRVMDDFREIIYDYIATDKDFDYLNCYLAALHNEFCNTNEESK